MTRSEFQPFVMERMMSKWENVVDVNLSESGVHPMTLTELLELGRPGPRVGRRRPDQLSPD